MAHTSVQVQFDPDDTQHIMPTVMRHDRGMLHIGDRSSTGLSFHSSASARAVADALHRLADGMDAKAESGLEFIGRVP